MKRYHDELQVMARRAGLWKWWTQGHPESVKPLGRWRKKKPLDCGKSNCGCCHEYKHPKRTPTRRERMNGIEHDPC